MMMMMMMMMITVMMTMMNIGDDDDDDDDDDYSHAHDDHDKRDNEDKNEDKVETVQKYIKEDFSLEGETKTNPDAEMENAEGKSAEEAPDDEQSEDTNVKEFKRKRLQKLDEVVEKLKAVKANPPKADDPTRTWRSQKRRTAIHW